jgi:hypothetical protein
MNHGYADGAAMIVQELDDFVGPNRQQRLAEGRRNDKHT